MTSEWGGAVWSGIVVGLAVWATGVLVSSQASAAERLREVGLDDVAGLAPKNWRKRLMVGVYMGLGASVFLFFTRWYIGVVALLVGFVLVFTLLPRLWLLHYRNLTGRSLADSAGAGMTAPSTAGVVNDAIDQAFQQVLDPEMVVQNEKTFAMIRNWSDGLAENNYEYFAFNIAVIVAILKRHFADRFPSEDALMATSGVMDLLPAVKAGLVSVEDMTRAVLAARLCQVSLDLEKVVHADASR
jgi:hypothetical protein